MRNMHKSVPLTQKAGIIPDIAATGNKNIKIQRKGKGLLKVMI